MMQSYDEVYEYVFFIGEGAKRRYAERGDTNDGTLRAGTRKVLSAREHGGRGSGGAQCRDGELVGAECWGIKRVERHRRELWSSWYATCSSDAVSKK